ncbi:MAG: hypothetical protein KDB00_14200 [Planctomycetales bacterium]|nr:hypothetical protein [Planctomycetales bacterium]
MTLQRIEIEPALGPVPKHVADWIATAMAVGKSVDCFDYIPSCAELLYGYLQVVPGKRYCEWGSGIGVGIGIAAALGFDATGIEINDELSRRSRTLLQQFHLNAEVVCASYHEVTVSADVVFVYCWPGQVNAVRERFESTMPRGTWLLLAEGAERFSAFLQSWEQG